MIKEYAYYLGKTAALTKLGFGGLPPGREEMWQSLMYPNDFSDSTKQLILRHHLEDQAASRIPTEEEYIKGQGRDTAQGLGVIGGAAGIPLGYHFLRKPLGGGIRGALAGAAGGALTGAVGGHYLGRALAPGNRENELQAVQKAQEALADPEKFQRLHDTGNYLV